VRHPGESPVYFVVRGPGTPAAVIRARTLLVNPCDELVQSLRARLGPDAVRLAEPDPDVEAVAV